MSLLKHQVTSRRPCQPQAVCGSVSELGEQVEGGAAWKNYWGRKRKIERAEAGWCASCSAGGIDRKDKSKPLDFGFVWGKRDNAEASCQPLVAWGRSRHLPTGAVVKVIWVAPVFAVFPCLTSILLLSITPCLNTYAEAFFLIKPEDSTLCFKLCPPTLLYTIKRYCQPDPINPWIS